MIRASAPTKRASVPRTRYRAERRVFERLKADCPRKARREYELAIHTLLILLVAALAQGCGFHLRGHAPAASSEQAQPFSVYLRVADASPLAAELRSQLAIAKVKIRDSMEGADYALSLSGENFKQMPLSVSPTTGKVEEYQIVFTLRVNISRADGELLVDNQALRISRDYTFDEEAALGKFVEEEGLREELIKQVVAQIIRQLSTVANRR